MFYLAKGLEALGIATVMIGLVLGINSPTLWIELYLLLAGVGIFLAGWGIEKYLVRTRKSQQE